MAPNEEHEENKATLTLQRADTRVPGDSSPFSSILFDVYVRYQFISGIFFHRQL